MRPTDFAGQLNVSLANGWGIVRTVVDLCMKQPEGKYVLVKDPNKVRAPFFARILQMVSAAIAGRSPIPTYHRLARTILEEADPFGPAARHPALRGPDERLHGGR